MPLVLALLMLAAVLVPLTAAAQTGETWVTAWAGSGQGPYPVGNPSAQPDLRLAFPDPRAGARDQTFRLIVPPDIWGRQTRLRFSNAFGTGPVTLDGVHVGLQLGGPALIPGTNAAATFGGHPGVTIAPGDVVWSDPIDLPFWRGDAAALAGRRLAVSFHVAGESGPMTWHAKALTTSYVGAPGTGATGHLEDESALPFSTTSWYFLDAVDMRAPAGTRLVVAFGDSITDGTASTLNGEDRWPNVLARRLHAIHGGSVAVVNAGIGGNQVTGPKSYSPQQPFAGGPSAPDRLERDVLSLSGVSTVIWLEGINDFSRNGNATAGAVETAMREVVGRIRARIPGVRVVGATLTSALGSSSPAHGFAEQDAKRRALNDVIRASDLFDGVIDFDGATLDPQTGGLRAELVPDSTTGGPGDRLHPNRAGYLAMGQAIDLGTLMTTAATGRNSP
ncbi:MAG: GDSL-type esterase/lipase family protein [Xanthobacteraceae bacterium]